MSSETDELQSVIRKYIVNELLFKSNESAISYDQPLIERGIIDSMGLITLVKFLENKYEISVSNYDMQLDNFRTVETISSLVQKLQTEQ